MGGRRESLAQRRLCELHIISRKKLLEAGKKHGGIAAPLDSWFRMAKTEIFYDDQVILVRHVLTHAEYDKGNWNNEHCF